VLVESGDQVRDGGGGGLSCVCEGGCDVPVRRFKGGARTSVEQDSCSVGRAQGGCVSQLREVFEKWHAATLGPLGAIPVAGAEAIDDGGAEGLFVETGSDGEGGHREDVAAGTLARQRVRRVDWGVGGVKVASGVNLAWRVSM
jgi:hypothetical protein